MSLKKAELKLYLSAVLGMLLALFVALAINSGIAWVLLELGNVLYPAMPDPTLKNSVALGLILTIIFGIFNGRRE